MSEQNKSEKCNQKIEAGLSSIHYNLDRLVSLTVMCECAIRVSGCPTERLADVLDMVICKILDIKEEVGNLAASTQEKIDEQNEPINFKASLNSI